MAGRSKQVTLLALCLLGTLLFSALGIWQIQRLGWKRDLIARVDSRIHSSPVAVPPRQGWAGLDIQDVEYLRVQARGVFLHDRETLVDALTARGPGAWVLTPLHTADGVILINRGFVASGHREARSRSAGQVQGEVMLTGLLRASEPRGRFLRPNKPAADRWFSRDIAAIAKARGIVGAAPFFIDVDAESAPPDGPTGGLTVVQFRNAHLVYAVTWFGLALLCLAGLFLLMSGRVPSARSGPVISR
jgi:surfeit locus 1 family protein